MPVKIQFPNSVAPVNPVPRLAMMPEPHPVASPTLSPILVWRLPQTLVAVVVMLDNAVSRFNPLAIPLIIPFPMPVAPVTIALSLVYMWVLTDSRSTSSPTRLSSPWPTPKMMFEPMVTPRRINSPTIDNTALPSAMINRINIGPISGMTRLVIHSVNICTQREIILPSEYSPSFPSEVIF